MHTNIHTTENSEAKVLSEDEKPTETTIENGRKDAYAADTVAEIAEATATQSSANKSNARRQSLNKKESKAKMSNIHAQPGEYYFIKLRGFPKWPGIVASEDMLPDAILKSRPVTAANPDGTYREDFAEGGKNALDRTFPVMFFETNEL
jgi:glucan-binding YG repeat protein